MSPEVWSLDDIVFARLIRPPSMRSTYWTYFGFPADSHNQIITRQKVVCTLCNTAIAYNRNTTNLKVHLSARHPDLDVSTHPKLKRVKYVYQAVDEDGEELDGVECPARPVSTVSETSYLDEIDLIIETVSEEIQKPESLDDEVVSRGYEIEYVDEATMETICRPPLDLKAEAFEEEETVDDTNIILAEDKETQDEALCEFLSSNMLKPNIVEDVSFQKFCSVLNYKVPCQLEVI